MDTDHLLLVADTQIMKPRRIKIKAYEKINGRALDVVEKIQEYEACLK